MDLPVRIGDQTAPGERVISVDGAWGAPGLNLSHWPGHTTPLELRHDLSTGSALLFAELPKERQAELAEGCTAIVNNHYDTDGTCALFALRYPELALPRRERLLAAAAAGDLFRFPDDHALCVSAIVDGLADQQTSPWRDRFTGLDERARHETVTHGLFEELPAILDGELAPFAPLWEPVLEAAHRDVEDLALAQRDDLVHLDMTVWTAPRGTTSSRASASRDGLTPIFDPGRHAVFGTSEADRALVVGPLQGGTTYRFLISTVSWFDLVTRAALERPKLERLAEALNALEGTSQGDEHAWRTQPTDGPSPELWFGTRENPLFSEHAPCLAPSGLDTVAVRRVIFDAARETLRIDV
jgi:hypothetical protein